MARAMQSRGDGGERRGRLLPGGMLEHERLQDGGDLLLLTAWKPRSGIEKLPHSSGWTIAALAGCTLAEQFLDVHAKNRRQLLKLVWTQGHRVAFPVRIRPLRHAQAFGQQLLGKPGLFAQRVQSRAERRPLFG